MHWSDEGYLLSRNNFDENSIIIESFTLEHGKYTGIVYGGSSRKQKKNFQVGNKILLNWYSKGENRFGYFNIELINPISPLFFDDKKRSICILSAVSILKILLPERQINKKIYHSLESMFNDLTSENWINLYIHWELSLIKELGYEINFFNDINLSAKKNRGIQINDKFFRIPDLILDKNLQKKTLDKDINEALIFNKNLLIENFIIPNRLILPLSRKILENYFK